MVNEKATPAVLEEQLTGIYDGKECIKDSEKQPNNQTIWDKYPGMSFVDLVRAGVGVVEPRRKTKLDILNELAASITHPDFFRLKYPSATEEELEERREKGEKIKASELKVLIVDEILRHADAKKWKLCRTSGFTYIYNGAYWEVLDDDDVKHFLSDCAMKMGIQSTMASEVTFVDNLYRQFLFSAHLQPPEFDNRKVLINLKNGTFEITTSNQKLKPFDPNDFITYQLPFYFNEDATAPLFDKYINRVLPDPTAQAVLAEYAGYLFMRNGTSLKFEKCLILHGSGANGKSVFYEVLTAMLGAENVSRYSLQELTDNTGYYRAEIANKLVNYASEISRQMNADLFKKLASGEPFTARSPYGRPFEVANYAKMIFNANELPKDTEQTNAFFRRFLIVPFMVTIPEEEQDKELHLRIINNELAGVFNWVLAGLRRLLANKRFTDCQAAAECLNQYKIDSDTVASFLIENDYKKGIDSRIPLKDFYQEYKAYCYEDGYRACSNRTFSERLRAKGYEITRSNGGRYIFAEKKMF